MDSNAHRQEPQTIVAALKHCGIHLPDDLIEREIRDAAEGVIGDPPFVSSNQRIDWSLLASMPAQKERWPLRAFVTALDHELRQQDCRRDTALPNSQLKPEDRRRVRLDRLGHEQPHRHLPRVRTALKVGALYATGLSLRETARLLDFDERTVSDWVKSRRLYSAPITSAPARLPLFQFDADGLVPKVQTVLPLLDAAIHPVGVFNWFTRPNPDLALEPTRFEPTSPRDWLLRRYPSKPVCRLATAISGGIAA